MIYKSSARSRIESPYMMFALALFSIDLKLQGVTIFLVASVFYFIINHRVLLDKGGAVLIFFCIAFSLFFFPSQYFDISIVKTVFAVVLAYLLGYSQDDINEKTVSRIIIWIAFFMAFHGVLNLLYNLSIFGLQAFSIARSYDFWSQSISGSTGQATKFTPFLSVFFYLLFVDKKLISKFFASVICIMMMLYNIELGGRSFFILFAVATLVSYIIFTIKNDTFKKSLKITFLIATIVIVLAVMYEADVFGIKTTFQSSYFFHRFFSVSGQKITEDDRIQKKIEYIKNIFNFPFGGSNIRTTLHVGYAHELWLDIFDMAGIIPYILLLVYTYDALTRVRAILGFNYFENRTYVVIGTYYFVMLLQFFIEPVIYGSPKLFISFALTDGLVARLLKQESLSYES